VIGKRHPGVLPIKPMTSGAVMGKRCSSLFDVVLGIRQGILHFFAADRHGVLDLVDGSGFPFSGGSSFARRKENSEAKDQDWVSCHTYISSLHSMTLTVNFIEA